MQATDGRAGDRRAAVVVAGAHVAMVVPRETDGRDQVKDEVLYSTPLEPDGTDTKQVLAFMLVPERIFVTAQDDAETLEVVREILDDAKRRLLIDWYSHHMRSRPMT